MSEREEIAKRIFWEMHSIMHDHELNWREAGKQFLYLDAADRVLGYLASLRQSSERDAVVGTLQAVAEFMRKDVQSGDSDLWTPEYEALHDQVIVALKGAKP